VPDVKELMKAFGTPILVHGDGPRGSLRRAATDAGVPTILFEAGEPGRFQPHVVDVGHHGILRVLRHLGMMEGEVRKPPVQLLVRESHWVRADHGGICELEVEPGDLVQEGQRIGRLIDPMGHSLDDVRTDKGGVVLGISTLPLVFPGKAIAHIGHLRKTMPAAKRFVDGGGDLGHVGRPT
jgi:predicted deacylase